MAEPKYRTKVFDYMMEKFIYPIIKFNGIVIEEIDGLKYLRYADSKDDSSYLRDLTDPNRKLVIVTSYDEFIRYKMKREEVSYFNPLTKYKNMLYLTLLSSPILYFTCCVPDMDDEDDLVSLVSEDEEPSQEDINKCVSIKQSTVQKDDITGESLYKFTIELKKQSTANIETDDYELIDYNFVGESYNKNTALIGLMLKVLTELDVKIPDIVKEYNGNFDNLDLFINECLDKYAKERKLNNRDMKKMKELEIKDGDFEFIADGETFDEENVLLDNESIDDLLNDEKASPMPHFNNIIDNSLPLANDNKESDQSFGDMEFL